MALTIDFIRWYCNPAALRPIEDRQLRRGYDASGCDPGGWPLRRVSVHKGSHWVHSAVDSLAPLHCLASTADLAEYFNISLAGAHSSFRSVDEVSAFYRPGVGPQPREYCYNKPLPKLSFLNPTVDVSSRQSTCITVPTRLPPSDPREEQYRVQYPLRSS